MTLADRPPPPARGPGCALWISLLVVLGVAAAASYLVLGRPRLQFSNLLAAPVRLLVAPAEPRTVAPGESVTLRLPRGRTLVAEWELVRPLSADGQPMGEDLRGTLVLRNPRGTNLAAAETRQGEVDYFAPLITNASGELLRVRVNAGLRGALDCGCAVRPGARRVFIGYYRLYRNSTVRVRGLSGGGEAMFRDLGPEVRRVDGAVGLRFEDKDLRPR